MDMKYIEAREYVIKAREALRRGDRQSARELGEQAALLAPNMEDVWLVLAASDSNPQDALAYAQKALEINAASTRARQAVEWASRRLRPEKVPVAAAVAEGIGHSAVAAPDPQRRVYREAIASPQLISTKRVWPYAVGAVALACAVFAFAAYSAVTHPALASIVKNVSAPLSNQEDLWAPVDVLKPTITPIGSSAFAVQAADTPTSEATAALTAIPTRRSTLSPTGLPTSTATEEPSASPTPAATETPGSMAMEIVADTPTGQSVEPAAVQDIYPAKGNGVRWIDVNLSEQRVYAYEGDIVVNSFIVSTGTARTPTVTGKFKIWIKLKSTTMSGPGYHLTNVPYAMYFYKGYGLHGTYWHNNFGTPMSHGCVNLTTADAGWLFNWAFEGTEVNVHY
ncbi:MAG: L,D-transpeptidase family protein [Chloroflexota bacterium]|nr:L,D-transpeptidase family protein [Chloroflexota bacterium]